MLEQITIRNYKCLADVTLKLGQFNVLIGPNDSGKTSILDAIEALGRLVNDGAADAFKSLGKVDDLITHGAEKRVIAFEAKVDNILYSVSVNPKGRIVAERLGGERNYVLREKEDAPAKLVVSHGLPKPQSRELFCQPGESILRWPSLVSSGVEPAVEAAKRTRDALTTLRCDLQPNSIRQATEPSKDSSIPHLDHDGRGLPTVLEYMVLTDRKRFDTLKSRLRELVDYIEELNVPPVNGKRQVAFKLKGDPNDIPAALASDGLLLLLGYLTLLYLPGPRPGILLIDEPENGVHPARLKEVVNILRELADKESVQIVMTTHSPYLLDFVEPEETHIVTREENLATNVTRMSDLPNIETLRKGYQLGELWFNYGEEALVRGVK